MGWMVVVSETVYAYPALGPAGCLFNEILAAPPLAAVLAAWLAATLLIHSLWQLEGRTWGTKGEYMKMRNRQRERRKIKINKLKIKVVAKST